MVDQAKTADLILALGGDQLLMGQYDKAVARFREAIRVDPSCGEAYAWLGKAYREMGRLDEAERAFRDAIRARPGFALAHYNLGLLYVARADNDRALEQYEILRTIHPVRAERLLEQINRREAKPEPVARQPEPDRQSQEDDSSMRPIDSFPASRRALRRRNPQLNDTVADVLDASETQATEPELEPEAELVGAHAEVEPPPHSAMVEPAPEPPAPPVDAAGPAAAVEALQKAAASDPRDTQAHWQLGRAYLDSGEYALAAQAIEKAIANQVDFAGSHPESVHESVEKCLALGLCNERLGRFEDAAKNYEQALDVDPENAEVHLRLGLVMLVLNNRSEAIEHYRELARLSPHRAETLLKRLLRLLAK